MKKYELTAEFKTNIFGTKLFRIKALISFGSVSAGELGGYIEKEENLDQYGNAWVYGDAWVYGNAEVYGNARVYGDAEVSGDAWVYGNARVSGNARVYGNNHYLVIGPIGSRFGFTTFFRDKGKEITVSCGCFLGRVDRFLEKVTETHGDSKHALVYRAAAEMAKMQIDLSGEDENETENI